MSSVNVVSLNFRHKKNAVLKISDWYEAQFLSQLIKFYFEMIAEVFNWLQKKKTRKKKKGRDRTSLKGRAALS